GARGPRGAHVREAVGLAARAREERVARAHLARVVGEARERRPGRDPVRDDAAARGGEERREGLRAPGDGGGTAHRASSSEAGAGGTWGETGAVGATEPSFGGTPMDSSSVRSRIVRTAGPATAPPYGFARSALRPGSRTI